ncbi:MAG: nucleoside-diphosphate sugar epimerase [Candidatus Zambryskibacteria bacterium RIFCSPHIGHO2_01_FULL_43_25]|uniref:Nucleoside-diphosphate sugar epimerase n=1 Tax=Candidatus Zambryskibacteria bacterium RIFCSPLOWO2_01_FULL_45_21 TaxID=1802761 RepID=A0A1G2U3H4_9BACT|nr:MAG: nucleoside-diphosphate sugar epimerase [Candidatus Zambryskibacteria bacterium RIFCSPHIGHO2_01_FULL_43_25]OHB00175.1 MAG: nucleoside-diphosphate sugar epimerase [Candidatus Zambryskibacteria bacterium RIFCSPHIGHO2_12_FULL_44_12b]OHB03440.1 MAG: nucleoside-diphosphate sugar epimerase [Candidatus Zambryskibacteria bacterium RIFCSPLOWO2_01_FULL_45_21]
MAKILITGSKGVVGSWLIKILSERGHAIFGVDLTHHAGSVGFEHEMSRSDFTYARCDVGNYRQLERIFEKAGPFDYVYHCAAEFGRWNGEDYYEQVWMTNAIGTKNVIRLQEKLGFKLIHFSSSEVYGDYPNVMTEDIMDKVEIKQMNDYALSKWVNEQQIRNSTIKHGTKTITVRLFNTYGPGEWYHPYRSVNCKFCYHALHGIPVIVYKGHQRTSSYLEDTCRTLANIVENFKPGETYNIGGKELHSIETLVKLVWKHSGASKHLINYADNEVLTAKVKIVDNTKAERDLGHVCTVDIDEGVLRTIEWMRDYYHIS